MRYELFRLAQLAFALALMFGAFLGGLAVGWWRWGREVTLPRSSMSMSSSTSSPSSMSSAPPSGTHHRINPDLFTPAEPTVPRPDLAAAAPGIVATARPEELAAPVDPFI
jgi:hypothetical protein